MAAKVTEAADETQVSAIAGQLICTCGCTMILSTCDCETAVGLLNVIRDKLDGGQSQQQIMDDFVGQYGEKELAAPKPEGFNLTAWILPFAVLVVGAVALYFLVRMWVGRGKAPGEEESPQESVQLDRYEDRLDKELEQFR